MKTNWLVLVTVFGLGGAAHGQGEIIMRNRLAGVMDAPVFDTDCVTRLDGPAFLAQTYVELPGSSLAPMGPVIPFRTGGAAGYIPEGVGVFIPGAQSGISVNVQLRAWEAAAGPTYEAAAANGGKHGFSNIVPIEPGFGTPSPPSVVGLVSFCLVPEPTTSILTMVGVIGSAVVFMLRRIG